MQSPPVRITGPLECNLLAVWAQNGSGGVNRKHQLGPLRRALSKYRDFLAERPSIVAGDFNNNVFWHRPGWRINHINAVAPAAWLASAPSRAAPCCWRAVVDAPSNRTRLVSSITAALLLRHKREEAMALLRPFFLNQFTVTQCEFARRSMNDKISAPRRLPTSLGEDRP